MTETQPAFYLSGKDSIGTPPGTNPAPNVFTVPLSPIGMSVAALNYNYAEIVPSSLSGYVYLDANNDGTREPGEPGIGGVTIDLTGTDKNGRSVDISTTTGLDGRYAFTELYPGNYSVIEVQPAGYLEGTNLAGSFGGVVSTSAIIMIAVPLSQNGPGYIFAAILLGSISGTVYYDYDRNGIFGPDDFGIAHAVVTLTGTDDFGHFVTFTTMTNAEGYYIFSDLRPGTYQIVESPPTAFVHGPSNPGSNGGDAGVRTLANINLPVGVNSVSNNFAEEQRANRDLADLAYHVGRSFARDTSLYDANPARFRAGHPRLAKFIAAGEVPKGVGTYPNAAYAYRLVPTLGTKEVPYKPWVGPVKVKNGHISSNGKAPVLPPHVPAITHSAGPLSRLRPRAVR